MLAKYTGPVTSLLAAILLAAAASVSVKATDGRAVAATFAGTSKTPAPAILLVVEEGRGRADWEATAARLADAGVASLAIEVRATPKDPAQAAPDIAGALAWLRKQPSVDPAHILLAGAGVPALSALVSASIDDKVAGLALILSPLKSGELDGMSTLGIYGPRPLFVAVGRGDKAAAKAALVFDGSAQGTHKIHLAKAGGRGARLLAGDPDALGAFIDWIRETSGLASPEITPTGQKIESPATPVPTCPGDAKKCG